MELVRLACNGCGADLELPEDARFVTCRYCGARLEVRHTDGAAFTRVRARVKKVEKKTAKLEREVRRLELQQELDDLERDWDERRQGLMNRSKNGSLTAPTRGNAVAVGAVTVLGGLVVASIAPGEQSVPMGLVLIVVGGVVAVIQHQKAVRFERAQSDYFDQRDEIERRIHALGRRKKRRRRR